MSSGSFAVVSSLSLFACPAESHSIYARLIIDDARPLTEPVKTVLDQQGKPDLPLNRVVDPTIAEEVLRERR